MPAISSVYSLINHQKISLKTNNHTIRELKQVSSSLCINTGGKFPESSSGTLEMTRDSKQLELRVFQLTLSPVWFLQAPPWPTCPFSVRPPQLYHLCAHCSVYLWQYNTGGLGLGWDCGGVTLAFRTSLNFGSLGCSCGLPSTRRWPWQQLLKAWAYSLPKMSIFFLSHQSSSLRFSKCTQMSTLV